MTDSRVNEETPLLFSSDDPAETTCEGSDKVTTPLPKLQIGTLLLALMAEPICSQSISPFINQVNAIMTAHCAPLTDCQLIRKLGITDGDDRKLGYYVGG